VPIFRKYSVAFPDGYDLLKAEMYMIRNGGQWADKKTGKIYGNGLSYHYEEMRKLLWPHLDSHRWHVLCRDEILKNKITVLMGPGSSAKTHSAAWIYLCEYLCLPDETLVLVSSTDMRGLRLRVWGEISDLWQKALDKYDYLPGNLLDSRVAITTDMLEDDDYDDVRRVRDMRKGIIGIPTIQGGKNVGIGKWCGVKQKRVRLVADEACFPAGQMVDTPTGRRPIESIKGGDLVFSAAGICCVRATMSRTVHALLRIKTRSGQTITCTPAHPIFTSNGWKCACHLNQGDIMVSTYEAMSILREGIPTSQQQQGVSGVSREDDISELQAVWTTVPEISNQRHRGILRKELHREMGINQSRATGEVLHRGAHSENSAVAQGVVCGPPGTLCRDASQDWRGREKVQCVIDDGAADRARQAVEPSDEGARPQTESARREWNWTNASGVAASQIASRCSVELSSQNRDEKRKRISNFLQTGSGDAINQVGDRSRWGISQDVFTRTAGREEGFISGNDRVDSVEVLKQKDFERYGGSESGVVVYNLEIEGHPSYSVNGFLVHNSLMGPSFLSAFSNLNNNADFRAIILGNPVDITDPLGIAAEPIDGWGTATMDTEKTIVWDTKFMNGRCVNLIGTDSPNFDYPEGEKEKFPYLIGPRKIREILSGFSKDSPEFYSQAVGSMKISQMARRVITRLLCRKYGALDQPIWKGTSRTKICSLDAAYGGDRCMIGWGEFGADVNGKDILAAYPPVVVPIIVGKDDVEDQISKFVKRFCEDNGIPPENFFHDSTGRGTLGTALARHWSNACNPVEFGGKPTARPVSLDMFVMDEETKVRRLKLSFEHYYNFVSELWYAVRYTIEANQLRALSEEVMDEGCKREWDWVPKGGMKVIQVEPKEIMKERTRQSPDQFDQLAILVEGARRKGFQISKLANSSVEVDDDALDADEEAYQNVLKKSLLQHEQYAMA